MATAALVSIEEYLRTSYEVDCDYVDGVIEDRNLGEWSHGDLQSELVARLRSHSREWNIRAATEIRVRVSPTRVRIPDVCVISREHPVEQVVVTPPILCIEVLSPEDRWSRVEKRIEDFLAMGVRHVWVFDPEEQQVFDCTRQGRRLITEETLEAPPISIHLPELFAALD
jgi:Uma2 family endonuclease